MISTSFSIGSGLYCPCLSISVNRAPRASRRCDDASRSEPNCANAAISRYCARSSLSDAGDLLDRLDRGREADARDRQADVDGGTHVRVEKILVENYLAVGDRDDVGRDVGRHVAFLGLDYRQRGQRSAAHLVAHLGGALEQSRMQIEDVAGIRLAAGRAAQQQRQLAIGLRMLAEIVVHEQRMLAAVAKIFAHRAAGVRRDVLQRRGFGSGRGDDGGELHRACAGELLDHLRDGRALLPDRHVDAVACSGPSD